MSVRITGDVCTYLASFVRGKGTKPKGIGRVWCVWLAVSITKAVCLVIRHFLLASLNEIDYVQEEI
nr:MAG TPA: hypothetical protein [Caudoviricetes sp.]